MAFAAARVIKDKAEKAEKAGKELKEKMIIERKEDFAPKQRNKVRMQV